MKTKINVFLIGSPLQSLRQYIQELDNQGDRSFSFCLNATLSLFDVGRFPDVVFINYGRNDLFGLTEFRKIKKLNPKTQVVMVVADADIKIGRHAVNHGALAYLMKGEHELQQIKRIAALCRTLIGKSTYHEPVRQQVSLSFLKNMWLPLKRFFNPDKILKTSV